MSLGSFGPNHYVPVLKIKRGEKAALQAVAPGLRERITPLLEVVERNPERASTVDTHLDNAFKGLASAASLYTRAFLDTREIGPDGPAAATEVFRRASVAGINFTPVTGISRSADVEAALAHRARSVAIRLTREEFEAGGLAARLQAFMNSHGLVPGATDLIIDLGALDDLVTAGISALADAFLAEVPDHPSWATFTISGGAFPPSMAVVGRHSHGTVERGEWLSWGGRFHAQQASPPRLPTFSDCAIQHPKGVEGFDFRTMQSSATVRYTLPENWLIIKGESTRLTPPKAQFPGLAVQLVYGHLRHHFMGAQHCEGCRLIKTAADGVPGSLGSPEAWRRLGTIHHITAVMDGLAGLSWL